MIERLIDACARNRGTGPPGRSGPVGLGRLDHASAAARCGARHLRRTRCRVHRVAGRSPDLVEDQVTYPVVTRAALGAARQGRARLHRFRHLVRLRRSSRTARTSTGREAGSSSTCQGIAAAARRRQPGDRPGRHGCRLGVPIRAGGRVRAAHSCRPPELPGLVSPVLAGGGARGGGGRAHRRVRQAVPGDARPGTGWRRTTCRRATWSRPSSASNHDVGGRLLEFAGPRIHGAGPWLPQVGLADLEQVALGSAATARRCWSATWRRSGSARRSVAGVAELDGRGRGRRRHRGHALRRERARRDRPREGTRSRKVEAALPEGVALVTDLRPLRASSSDSIRHAAPRRSSRRAIVVSLVRSFPVPLPLRAHPDHHPAHRGLASFIPMYSWAWSPTSCRSAASRMAIGELVDASIVMVENAYQARSRDAAARRPRSGRSTSSAGWSSRPPSRSARPSSSRWPSSSCRSCRSSCSRRRKAGMFRPLAYTKTFAMFSATLLSITLVPVLMTVFVRGRQARVGEPGRQDSIAMYRAHPGRGAPVAVDGHPAQPRGHPAVLPLRSASAASSCRRSYEGSILYMPTAPPGLSVTEVTRALQVAGPRYCASSPRWIGSSGRPAARPPRPTTPPWAW